MHDKLISWDSQTEEDKLTVLRQLVFKAGDKQNVGEKCRSNFTFPGTITALDIQKAIPKELPGELTKHAVSETKKVGNLSRGIVNHISIQTTYLTPEFIYLSPHLHRMQ